MGEVPQYKIDAIKELYGEAIRNDIDIIKREHENKLDECRVDLEVEMNAEIREMLKSHDNAMRKEIRELKESWGDDE